MPKSTFFNLADSKRKAFLHEAYKEFSHHSFEAASITNLVKSLGIAKGSVYQYFNDKEDLYDFLIKDAERQMDQLINNTCPYNGENFFDWYTNLLMVKVKFLLSFPQFAVLFQKLFVESGNPQRSIAVAVEEKWLSQILANLPPSFHNSTINNKLLTRSPLLIFEILTNRLNLNKLIEDEDPVFLESEELVAICSSWVAKLKDGI